MKLQKDIGASLTLLFSIEFLLFIGLTVVFDKPKTDSTIAKTFD
jgi:hypothetical protein